MALGIKVIRKIKFGNAYGVVAELTGDKKAGGDAGYPTGGYSLTARQLGLNVIENVLPQSPASGVLWEYDFANSKIKVLEIDKGDEVANESDQSAKKTRIVAFGW